MSIHRLPFFSFHGKRSVSKVCVPFPFNRSIPSGAFYGVCRESRNTVPGKFGTSVAFMLSYITDIENAINVTLSKWDETHKRLFNILMCSHKKISVHFWSAFFRVVAKLVTD